MSIARDLDNEELLDLATELEGLVGSSTQMCYPDNLHYPDIPHDLFTAEQASRAHNYAENIVELCEAFI